MASYLPGHHFPSGRHHVLYQATDAEGNKAKCGFTITVKKGGGGGGAIPGHTWSHLATSGHTRPAWFSPVTPPPSAPSSSSETMVGGGFFNQRHHHRYNVPEKCYRAPPIRD